MIKQLHPPLEGIALDRFYALGQEIMRRQRSGHFHRISELAQREAEWALTKPGLNGERTKYEACARILVDLAKARWKIAEDRFGIEVRSPEENDVLDIVESKRRVRAELQPLLEKQFSNSSVQKFISAMEQPSGPSKTKPITDLIADGREVFDRLQPAIRAKNEQVRLDSLRNSIRPYLQLVVSDVRDKHTNLLLGDIWRYFRYSWCIPQLPNPGRQLLYLVRDAGHPCHAIMGIAALNNCAMQSAERDKFIGWTGDAFIEKLQELLRDASPDKRGQLENLWRYLEQQLDLSLSHIETKGLCKKADLANPTLQIVDALRRRSGHFSEIRRDALESISESREVPDEIEDYELSESELPPVSDKVLRLEDTPLSNAAMTQARRMLVARKRSAELARLLDARLVMRSVRAQFESPDAVTRCLESDSARAAIHTVLLATKSERVGTSMLEITTCGAIPPYNPLLVGKLVSLLMLSPEVASDYQGRYGDEASIISSQLKNQLRTKDATLVFLGTTSLFSEGASQYERLKLPAGIIAPEQPELRYRYFGETHGYGTVQFSPETVRSIETVLETAYGYQEVNSIFGEGFSPRLRKLRAGLQMLGFTPEHLLKHNQLRRVYGVCTFSGSCDYLMGRKVPVPEYVAKPHKFRSATISIADFWARRWLSKRLHYEPAIDALLSSKQWKLSEMIPAAADSTNKLEEAFRSPVRPSVPPHAASAIEFWRSIAYGGAEVCSDVLDQKDLERLHIPQEVEEFMLERVRKGYSIVLTGNAGDGKTHLLRRLEDQLEKIGASVQHDASAAMDKNQILPVVNEWRRASRSGRSYCLAANEYPLYLLREYGQKHPAVLPSLAEVDRQCRQRLVYGAHSKENRPKTATAKVLVIDLSLRNPLSPEISGAMVDRLLSDSALSSYADSGIDLNFAESFRRLSHPLVRQRLLLLFDRIRLMGFHCTLREIWILLASLLFGRRPPAQVVAGRYSDWYSERLFDPKAGLNIVQLLRKYADPACASHPRWDLRLEDVDGTKAEEWVVDSSIPTLDRRKMALKEGRVLFDAIKRRFYFEHKNGTEAFGLEQGFLQEFRELLTRASTQQDDTRENIIGAINRCYCPTTLSDGGGKLYLWIGHRFHEQPTRTYIAESFFHSTQLELVFPRLPERAEKAFLYHPEHIVLQLRNSSLATHRLIVDYPLYRTLRRVQQGLPRHLLPERDLNRLDTFIAQLHGAMPQKSTDFIVYNQESLLTTRIQLDDTGSQYLKVTESL